MRSLFLGVMSKRSSETLLTSIFETGPPRSSPACPSIPAGHRRRRSPDGSGAGARGRARPRAGRVGPPHADPPIHGELALRGGRPWSRSSQMSVGEVSATIMPGWSREFRLPLRTTHVEPSNDFRLVLELVAVIARPSPRPGTSPGPSRPWPCRSGRERCRAGRLRVGRDLEPVGLWSSRARPRRHRPCPTPGGASRESDR